MLKCDYCCIHPLSTYQLIDIPLDENNCSEWLCNDEINLIEMIEICGVGNWSDFSRSTSCLVCFQSFSNSKTINW